MTASLRNPRLPGLSPELSSPFSAGHSRGRLTTVRALFKHSSKQTSRHAPARNRHVNQSCVVVAPVVAAVVHAPQHGDTTWTGLSSQTRENFGGDRV